MARLDRFSFAYVFVGAIASTLAIGALILIGLAKVGYIAIDRIWGVFP